MLSSIFISQTVAAVQDMLKSAEIDGGTISVLDQPRLGRALAEAGHHVIQVSDKAKVLKRASGDRLCSPPEALPLADAQLAALIAYGFGQREDWRSVMTEWSRVVRDRGAIISIDRSVATELTRRALCSGLVDIQQRQIGRTIVTSGQVVKLE